MQKLTAYRSSDRVYNLLLYVISFTFLIVWLPFIRSAFDGATYQWGQSYFGIALGGKGITADYGFLVLEIIFYAALFLSVYRVKNRRVFFALLGVWWLHFFGNMIFGILQDPSLSFRGDTLGVDVPLIYIIIPLALIAMGLVVWVIRKDLKGHTTEIPWNKRNRLMAWIILGPLPLQFILLRFGPHLSLVDQIGVIITIAQCLLLPLIVKPYSKK